MTWQPIETAPQDGTPILACYGDHYTSNGFLPVAVRWRTYHPNAAGKEAFRDAAGHKVERITHWMPLPAPPEGNSSVAIASPEGSQVIATPSEDGADG